MEFIVKIRARMEFEMLKEILEKDIDIEKVELMERLKKFAVDKNHKIECPRCDAPSPEVAVSQDGESTHECPNCGKFKITYDGDIIWVDK